MSSLSDGGSTEQGENRVCQTAGMSGMSDGGSTEQEEDRYVRLQVCQIEDLLNRERTGNVRLLSGGTE